jgi:hypothetical protein
MAFSLRQFLRHTPPRTLKSYCDSQSLDLPDTVDWAVEEKVLVKALYEAIDGLPIEIRSQVAADFERVEVMTDEVGERAMLGAATNRERLIEVFSALESAHERSLWLFLHEPDAFHRAEEIRYADYYRESRSWDGFIGPVGAAVSREPETVKAFEQRLKDHHRAINGSGRSCISEIFDRDGPGLAQASIYLEGLPSSTVEFAGTGLTRRLQRPAIEAAITYSPGDGAIDVIAKGGKPVREAVCKIFVETLLKTKADIEPIVLRRYDLSGLRRPHEFPTDPEDGIKSVAVTRVRLRPYGDGAGRLTIEAGRNDGAKLHNLSRVWFNGRDPLANGFMVQHAKLSIEFYPRTGARRGKVLSFEITVPNKCSLKDHTEKERLIGEKYLGRWGLVREV